MRRLIAFALLSCTACTGGYSTGGAASQTTGTSGPAPTTGGGAQSSTTGATSSGAASTTAGGASTGGTSSAGSTGSTGGSTGTVPGLLSSIDFEDGMLHDWSVVNGIDAVQTAPASSTAPTWGVVDSAVTTPAHGSKCFEANAPSDYTNAVLLRNTAVFPRTPDQFYVRYYIKLTTALPQTHNTFAIVSGTGGGASGTTLTEVRTGGQFGDVMINLETNDATRSSAGLQLNDPNAVMLTPGQWYCMEAYYDAVTPTQRTWINGTEVPLLDVLQASDWSTPPSTAGWMPAISEFKLGWQSYGNAGNDVFLDDIAIGTSRIGCL